MNISTHINELFVLNGAKFKLTYKLYTPEIPSDNYLLFGVGSGERAVKRVAGKEINVTDGSLINLVEKNGYPKHAKNGFEFPFNIVVVQPGVSYSGLKKCVLQWMVEKFTPSKIILTGLSLGGMYVNELMATPAGNLVTAFAPVCGKFTSTKAAMLADKPGQAWHGDLDTQVKYSADRAFVAAYNKTHTNQIELVTLNGVAHNAWDPAYDVRTGKDQLLQWIITQFNG